MARILLHIFSALFVLCLAPRPALTQETLPPHFEARFATFVAELKRREDASSSETYQQYNDRCGHSFGNGIVLDYLVLASNSDNPSLGSALAKIDAQARCVSAARFRDVYLAFQASFLDEAALEESGTVGALLPLAYLLWDYASPALKFLTVDWLSTAVERVNADDGVEVYFPTELGIYPIGVDWRSTAGLVLGSSGWVSGLCRSAQISTVDVPIGSEVLALGFCPADCSHPAFRERVVGAFQVDGRPSAQIAEACEAKASAEDQQGASASAPAIRQCLKDFSAANSGLLACMTDAAIARKPLAGSVLTSQPTAFASKQTSVNRRCWQSQGGSTTGRWTTTYRTRVDQAETPGGAYKYRRDAVLRDPGGNILMWDQIENQRLEDGTTIQDRENIDYVNGTAHRTTVTRNADGDVVEREETAIARDSDGNWSGTKTITDENGNVSTRPYTPGDDEIPDDAADVTAVGDSDETMCSPLDDTCANDCSILDQGVQAAAACLGIAQDTASLPSPGSGPDPLISQPDPTVVEEINSELLGLQQCLMDAIGVRSSQPITQNDCRSYTRCPNGEEPRGEGCTCGLDQQVPDEGPIADFCPLVVCDSSARHCPCEELELGGAVVGGLPGSPEPRPIVNALGEYR